MLTHKLRLRHIGYSIILFKVILILFFLITIRPRIDWTDFHLIRHLAAGVQYLLTVK